MQLFRVYHTLDFMRRQYVDKLRLPDAPGVYIFRDHKKRPLYIGRASSLKDRVKSYFLDNIVETRGPRIVDMIAKSKSLTWQVTDSVLEAVLLESRLIKRYQPPYNVDERDDKTDQYVIITNEKWPRVFLMRAREFEQMQKEKRISIDYGVDGSNTAKKLEMANDGVKKAFGPYPNSVLIKEALNILRKLFPFRDKKAYDHRHESFYRSIGRSPEVTDDGARKKYLRTIDQLILFFEGNKEKLRIKIKKWMDMSAKSLRFEEANRAKRLLFALDHINDITLIKAENKNGGRGLAGFRIEAYDIAHLSGTNVVGAMSVLVNGERAYSHYRKFKISKDKNDDLAGLREILSRRLNHSEWAYPDLIVVDGNKAQLKTAEDTLRSRHMNIPVVAVTKDERHLASYIIGSQDIATKYQREIVASNIEAHRFALKYQRQKRERGFFA